MSYNNKDDPSSSSSLNGIENVSIALKFKKRLAVIYIRNERGEKAVSKMYKNQVFLKVEF